MCSLFSPYLFHLFLILFAIFMHFFALFNYLCVCVLMFSVILNRLKFMSISSRHLQHQNLIPSVWFLLCHYGNQQRISIWCHLTCNSIIFILLNICTIHSNNDTIVCLNLFYLILQTTPPEPPDSNVTKLRMNSPVRTSHSFTVPSSDDVITNRELNCKHVTAD